MSADRHRLTRILRLMALLPGYPSDNLYELARDLDTDARTIRRDGQALEAAGLARRHADGLFSDPDQLSQIYHLAGE